VEEKPMPSEVIIRDTSGGVVAVAGVDVVLPSIIALAGDRAARRFLEFFAATIRNANTREAYYRACCRFFAWCEQSGLDDLPSIEPLHVAAYIEALGGNFEKPTVKQHLAAIRMLFD
jgi:site-specific recombinase XerD